VSNPLHRASLSDWSRWTIAAAILLFPLAPRPAEGAFVAYVVLVGLQVRWRESFAGRRRWAFAATLLALFGWATVHVHEVWGYGRHTWRYPLVYPVDWWDIGPFLIALLVLAGRPLPNREARAILWALAATVPLSFAFGVVQHQMTNRVSWILGTPSLPLVRLLVNPIDRLRVDGGYYNPPGLGFGMIFSFLAVMALLALERRAGPDSGPLSRWRRRFLIACVPMSVLLICWSGSRAAWLWFCAVVVGSSLRWRLDPRKTLLPLAVGLSLVLLAAHDFGPWTARARVVVPDVIWQRIEGGDPETVASDMPWRLRAFSCAAELIREKPLTGWGLGGYAPECERRLGVTLNHAHNVELQLKDEESAGQLQLVGQDGYDYRYVVMPMRI